MVDPYSELLMLKKLVGVLIMLYGIRAWANHKATLSAPKSSARNFWEGLRFVVTGLMCACVFGALIEWAESQ